MPPERDRVGAILRGDPEAIAEVSEWIRSAAAPFRSRFANDWEDAVQEALVELVEALRAGRFGGRGSLRGFVWRLAQRDCIDRLRRSRTRLWEALDEAQAVSGVPDPLDDLLAAERGELLRSLLDRLPRRCHDIWRGILRGESYRALSRSLGVSEGALRVQALRCRRRALALAEGVAGAPRQDAPDEGNESRPGAP